jgi:long-chain fatty acid transport protein
MTTRKEPVLNAALGAEYYFTRNWALRGGLFSNRSNSPDVKGLPNEQTEKIDVYGVSLSLTRFIKSTSFTAGSIYSYGSGKAQITSMPGSVDAIYQSWTIFVASSYSF